MTDEGENVIKADDVVNSILLAVWGVALNDKYWKFFGFKKRPRWGLLFERFVSKGLVEQKNFLSRELMLLPLVEMACALRETLSAEMCCNIIGRVLEVLIDGLDPKVPYWPVLDFPSKQAAVKYFSEGLTEYTALDNIKQRVRNFFERMIVVVPEKKIGDWIVGTTLLTNSPIATLESQMRDFLEEKTVIGKAKIQNDLYAKLANDVLYPEA